jgi:hypothetical protein
MDDGIKSMIVTLWRYNDMSKKILIPIVMTLVLALVAGFWISGALAGAPADDGGGRLQRLRAVRRGLGQVTDIGNKQFTIQKLDGEGVTLRVTDETRFFDRQKTELSFDDLEVGQWVVALGAEEQGNKHNARIVVILPEDFDPNQFSGAVGKITSVNLGAMQFTLQDRQGVERIFDVNQDTRFRGAAGDLEDLQEGMGAGVRAQEQAGGGMLALVVVTRAQVRKYTGQITSVDQAAGTFNLRTRRAGELTFAVDENTRFRTRDGELDGLEDLEAGMVAIVAARVSGEDGVLTARLVGAVSRDQLPSFDKRLAGRVISVDKNAFTIQARDGQEYTFQVTGSTKFRSRGAQVQGLEDLEEGMVVLVGAKELGNGRLQAEVVVVGKQPGGSNTGLET